MENKPLFCRAAPWLDQSARKRLLHPSTLRLRFGPAICQFARSLMPRTWEEDKSEEYQLKDGPASLWVEIETEAHIAGLLFSRDERSVILVFSAGNVIGPISLQEQLAKDPGPREWSVGGKLNEPRIAIEAYAAARGLIRAYNVVSEAYLEKTVSHERPRGRTGTGMPLSRLEFSRVDLRSHRVIDGEHTATDRHGVRHHFVRGHWMNKSLPREQWSWRKSHWRGDPTLGTVRKAYALEKAA